MSIKEIIESDLDYIKGYVSNIYSSLEYIEDYGHVGLYDKNISENDIKNKTKEARNSLDLAAKLCEDVEETIQDQFQY